MDEKISPLVHRGRAERDVSSGCRVIAGACMGGDDWSRKPAPSASLAAALKMEGRFLQPVIISWQPKTHWLPAKLYIPSLPESISQLRILPVNRAAEGLVFCRTE